jgi:hypothetical protein
MRKIGYFFPENIGKRLSDETSCLMVNLLLLTNKGKRKIVAMIAGTKAEQLLLLSNKFRLKNEIRLPRSP